MRDLLNSLAWLLARTWGRWLVVLVVAGVGLYAWNLSQDHYFMYVWSRRLPYMAGVTATFALAWSCFTPRVPPGKIALTVLTFPLFRTPKGGRVIGVDMEQGVQAYAYGPGRHFYLFFRFVARLEPCDMLVVPRDQVGILNANDGAPLHPGMIVTDKHFTLDALINGELALFNGMHKGIQHELLPPGNYVMSATRSGKPESVFGPRLTFLYDVILEDLLEIDPRFVAVLISNKGGAPSPDDVAYWGRTRGDYSGAVLRAADQTRATSRGILPFVLQPGRHAVNRETASHQGAFKIVQIDMSRKILRVRPSSASRDGALRIDPRVCRSQDGHEFFAEADVEFHIPDVVEVEDTAGIRVPLPGAVLLVARYRSLRDFIEQVVGPIVSRTLSATAKSTPYDLLVQDTGLFEAALRRALDRHPEIVVDAAALHVNDKQFPETQRYRQSHADRVNRLSMAGTALDEAIDGTRLRDEDKVGLKEKNRQAVLDKIESLIYPDEN